MEQEDGQSPDDERGISENYSEVLSNDMSQFSVSGKLSENNTVIVEQLDQLEAKIERLRVAASSLEEERDLLTKTLTDVAERSNKNALTEGLKPWLICVEKIV